MPLRRRCRRHARFCAYKKGRRPKSRRPESRFAAGARRQNRRAAPEPGIYPSLGNRMIFLGHFSTQVPQPVHLS